MSVRYEGFSRERKGSRTRTPPQSPLSLSAPYRLRSRAWQQDGTISILTRDRGEILFHVVSFATMRHARPSTPVSSRRFLSWSCAIDPLSHLLVICSYAYHLPTYAQCAHTPVTKGRKHVDRPRGGEPEVVVVVVIRRERRKKKARREGGRRRSTKGGGGRPV